MTIEQKGTEEITKYIFVNGILSDNTFYKNKSFTLHYKQLHSYYDNNT